MEDEGAGLRPRLSSSRKRTRFSSPPPELVSGDDSGGDDSDFYQWWRQFMFEDAAADHRDEREQQIERIAEYDPLFDVYGLREGQDVEEPPQQGGGGDQPHQEGRLEQEDDISDDDVPIMLLSRRRRTVLRPGPTPPSPARVEDGDDERPIRLPLAPAAPPEPEPSSSCSDSTSSSVIKDATVDNSGAVDCVICFLPLKPPIFQCNVGHVICSRCSERQGQATNCHECRAPTPGGYTRCHAMERLVDSIRVPCPYAAHGCAHRPAYHARDAHAVACLHKPCHCPGEACILSGSPAALYDHLAADHTWPCTTVDGGGTKVFLRDGFNFITTTAKGTKKNRLLFLLDVKPAPPFGCAVAAVCIHPDSAATATLKLTYRGDGCMHLMCNMHLQSSEFKVTCTDLADEVPDPGSNDCFQFVVPGSVDDGATIRVIVDRITPPRPST